jgi:hypothetical protein
MLSPAPTRPTATPGPITRPAPLAPLQKLGCDPPYTTDEKGHIHFKRDCMH